MHNHHILLFHIAFFSFILTNLSSCNECDGLSESPCFSPDISGKHTITGDIFEKVNDSTIIPVLNCTVMDSGWHYNDTQCGDTQCPMFSRTVTDSTGHFQLSERPSYTYDYILYISKEGFKDTSIFIKNDTFGL